MRRFVGILAVFAILATATVAWRAIPNQASTLSGAWLLASVTDTAGNVNEAPQPGLWVITGTHYSMMYVNGNERRERYPGDSPTDAERLAAYNTVTANSGRYEVDGDQLTFRAYVAKNPNYMGDWPDNGVTVTFQVDGDTLHWTWPTEATWPTAADEDDPWSNGSVFTFTRIEGQPAP